MSWRSRSRKKIHRGINPEHLINTPYHEIISDIYWNSDMMWSWLTNRDCHYIEEQYL